MAAPYDSLLSPASAAAFENKRLSSLKSRLLLPPGGYDLARRPSSASNSSSSRSRGSSSLDKSRSGLSSFSRSRTSSTLTDFTCISPSEAADCSEHLKLCSSEEGDIVDCRVSEKSPDMHALSTVPCLPSLIDFIYPDLTSLDSFRTHQSSPSSLFARRRASRRRERALSLSLGVSLSLSLASAHSPTTPVLNFGDTSTRCAQPLSPIVAYKPQNTKISPTPGPGLMNTASAFPLSISMPEDLNQLRHWPRPRRLLALQNSSTRINPPFGPTFQSKPTLSATKSPTQALSPISPLPSPLLGNQRHDNNHTRVESFIRSHADVRSLLVERDVSVGPSSCYTGIFLRGHFPLPYMSICCPLVASRESLLC